MHILRAVALGLFLLPVARDARASDVESCGRDVADIAGRIAADPTQAGLWGDLLECQLRLGRFGDATSAVKTISLSLGEPAVQELFADRVATVTVEGLGQDGAPLVAWLTGDADLPSDPFVRRAVAKIGAAATTALDAGGGPASPGEVASWHRSVQALLSRHPSEEAALRPALKALAGRTDDPFERAMVLCPAVGSLSGDDVAAITAFLTSATPSDAAGVGVVQRCLAALPAATRSEVVPQYVRKAAVGLALGATSGQDAGLLLRQAALLLNVESFEADTIALPFVQTWVRAPNADRAGFVYALDAAAALRVRRDAAADGPQARAWRALEGILALATWLDQGQRDQAVKKLQAVIDGGADSLSESLRALLAAGRLAEGTYPVGRSIRSKAWSWSGEQDVRLEQVRVDAEGVLHLELNVSNRQTKDSMFIVGTSSSGRPQLLDGAGNAAAPAGPHTGAIGEKRGYFDGAWVVATLPGESKSFELHFRPPAPGSRTFKLSFPQQNGYQNELEGFSFTIFDHAEGGKVPRPSWRFEGPYGGFELGEGRASVLARNNGANGTDSEVKVPWEGRKGLDVTVQFERDRLRSVTYAAPGEGALFAPEAGRLADLLGAPSAVRPPRRTAEDCDEQVSTWKPEIGRTVEITRTRCPSAGAAKSSSMTIMVK